MKPAPKPSSQPPSEPSSQPSQPSPQPPPKPSPRPAAPADPVAAISADAAFLDDSLRDALVMDRGGYAYVIHPLLDGVPRASPRLLAAWADWAAGRSLVREATVLLAPEAMALPLAAALSLRTGLPYAIARKRSYGGPREVVAESLTGYGKSALHVNDLGPGDRALVIDDVVSTGRTLTAVAEAVRAAGATPVGALVFVDKGTPQAAAPRVAAASRMPVEAMRRIDVETDASGRRRVRILDA